MLRDGWREMRPVHVTVNLDDNTMDRILDDLTERAGLPRNTSALNLARWDLKAVLEKHGYAHGKGLT